MSKKYPKYISPSDFDTAEEFWDAVERSYPRYEQEAQDADDAWSEREQDNA
jgi:hypothetical protein